jgi:hypothetical protein
MLLDRAGDPEQANRAFCAALQLQEDQATAWEQWGVLCERMAVDAGDGDGPGRSGSWAVAAMTCHLNALRAHADEEPQRRLAARALMLLSLRAAAVAPADSTGGPGAASAGAEGKFVTVGATFATLAELVDAA